MCKKSILGLLSAIVLTTAGTMIPLVSFAEPMNCPALVKYRDGQLATDMDKAFKKYNAANKSLSLLQEVQQESQSLRAKQPTVQAAYQLVLSLNTAVDAVATILHLNPATGIAVDAAKKSGTLLGKIINVADGVSVASAITDGAVLEHIIAETVAEQVPVGAALVGVYKFGQNLKEQKDAYQDGEAMLDVMDTQLAGLEKRLRQVQSKLEQQDVKIKAINVVKNKIDGACG